jgi:signal transduction histidine kinase
LWASLSHELKSPITTAQQIITLAKRDETVSDKAKQLYLAPIECQLELQKSIIHDIQDLIDIEEGTFEVTFNQFSLEDVLQHCLAMYAQ